MRHDIRALLGSLTGFSDLLGEPGLDAVDRERYLEVISRNSHKLLSVFDNIFDLTQIEAGTIDVICLPLSMKSLLAETVLHFKPIATQKKVDFILKPIPHEVSKTLYSDPERIQKILNQVFEFILNSTSNRKVSIGIGGTPSIVTVDIENTHIRPDKLGLESALVRRLAFSLGGDLTFVTARSEQHPAEYATRVMLRFARDAKKLKSQDDDTPFAGPYLGPKSKGDRKLPS
jgi:hypothetical protein